MSGRKVFQVFQIFRSGRHSAMSGQSLHFSDSDLASMAAAYSGSRSVAAPLVLGHPHPKAATETFGEVQMLFATDGALVALANVSDYLVDLVRDGRYKNVSASFIRPGAAGNPVPGVYMLNHVGFLGAQPPAVKGMAPLQFAGAPGDVFFGEAAIPVQNDHRPTFSTDQPARRRLHSWQAGL